MMTNRTGEKLNENTALLCKDLGIPYDPESPETDPRAQMIYNAFLWTADDVEKQMEQIIDQVTVAGQIFKDELDRQDKAGA